MTRPGVTYLDVISVAQQLIASGTEPTIERIRALLKTGSNSTIGTHLRTWRAKQDPMQQLATREKIPEELVALLKGLWDRVMEQAESQVDIIKQDTQQTLTQHQQTIVQLQKDNVRLQQSESQTKHSCNSLTQEKAALEQIIMASRSEITAFQAKQEALLRQVTDKQSQIDELRKQNQQVQANLEHYRAASLEQRQRDEQRAQQQERELTQCINQLKIENQTILTQKMDLQQANEKLQYNQSNLQHELTKSIEHAESVSSKLAETNILLAQKSESSQQWELQYQKIYLKWEEQLQITADLQAQNAVLSAEGTSIKSELNELKQQNKVLSHDKWILGQEKAQLLGQMKQLQITL